MGAQLNTAVLNWRHFILIHSAMECDFIKPASQFLRCNLAKDKEKDRHWKQRDLLQPTWKLCCKMTKRGALRRWVWESHGSCRRPDRIENGHLVQYLDYREEWTRQSQWSQSVQVSSCSTQVQRRKLWEQAWNIWEADGLCMSEPSLLTQFGGSQLRSQSWRFPVPCPDWQTEFPGEAQNDVKTQPHRTALTFDGFESPFNDSNSTNDSLCTLFYPVVSCRVKYFIAQEAGPVWLEKSRRPRQSFKMPEINVAYSVSKHPNVWNILNH